MSVFKHVIRDNPDFIFTRGEIDSIFDHYYNEFWRETQDVSMFVAMFLNIVRDFLTHEISEETLSALINKSLFDERTKQYHYEPYLWSINDVLALLHELLDVTWTKGSDNYSDYLIDLEARYTALAEKYQIEVL